MAEIELEPEGQMEINQADKIANARLAIQPMQGLVLEKVKQANNSQLLSNWIKSRRYRGKGLPEIA